MILKWESVTIAGRGWELLEDPRRRREIGRGGQKLFRKKFNLENGREKLDSIYQKMKLTRQKDEPAN